MQRRHRPELRRNPLRNGTRALHVITSGAGTAPEEPVREVTSLAEICSHPPIVPVRLNQAFHLRRSFVANVTHPEDLFREIPALPLDNLPKI